MAKYFSLITNVGSAQISNAVALGKTIKLTHMAVGDGGGTNPLPDVAQTKLVNETYRAMINSLSIDKENPNIIIAEFILPEDIGGFYVREVGVFDEAGNLVAVGNTPESYKAKMSEGSGAHKVIRVYIATSASDKIELKINPSVVLATREYVDELIREHSHKDYYSEIEHLHLIKDIEDFLEQFPSSKLVNGWQKLPNGLIIQWGRADINASLQSTTTVMTNLPIVYPKRIFIALCTSSEPGLITSTIDHANHALTISVATRNSAQLPPSAIRYIAIGE